MTTFSHGCCCLFVLLCLGSQVLEAQTHHGSQALFSSKILHQSKVNAAQPSLQESAKDRDDNSLRLTGERYDNWDNQWKGVDSTVYHYANNRLSETITREYDGFVWVQSYRDQYEYDANGNNTTDLKQNWDGAVWIDNNRITKTFNLSNQCTMSVGQHWNTGAWGNSYRYLYDYDTGGHVILETYQYWNSGAWTNSGRSSYEYNPAGKPTLYTTQFWNGSVWENLDREVYQYDANNNLIILTYQNWPSPNWENAYRDSYEYNAANRVTFYLEQAWDGAAWVNYNRYINTYNGAGKWINVLTQDWDTGVWVNSSKFDIDEADFDASISFEFGSLFNSYVLYEWDNSLNSWVNVYRYFGYFETFVGLSALQPSTDLQVYPNPSDGSFWFDRSKSEWQPQRFTLSDGFGRQLQDRELSENDIQQINTGYLPSGQYYLKLYAKDGKQTVVPIQIR